MTEYDMYVLHSPYPDGTWRGLEKCCGTETGYGYALLVFHTPEEALDHAKNVQPVPGEFRVVRVTLQTPDVRGDLHRRGDSA